MSKVIRNARKSRSVKAPVNMSAAMLSLALTFDAHVDDTQSNVNDEMQERNELCVIAGADDASEADIFECYKQALAHAFVERITFELNKSATSCADKHRKYARNIFDRDIVLRELFSAQVMPDFVNVVRVAGKRKNEKVTMRMIDICDYLTGNKDLTNYTRAIFQSMYRFEQAGLTFTREHAQACCSNERNFAPEIEALLTHTKFYDAGTVAAQHSMSVNALISMNAISRTGKVYSINRESYVAQALIAKLALV